MAYTSNEKSTGLDVLTDVTLASGDLHIIGDISDSGRAKAITQDLLEDYIANSTNFVDELVANAYFTSELANSTAFIDALVANTYFTTELANDSNFISELTSNTTFQNAVNNFISSSSSTGGGGKPMTFSITDSDSPTPSPLSGYMDREALVYSSGATIVFQDILGYTQSRATTADWASATSVVSFVLIDSFIYVLLSDGSTTLRVYRYSATDMAAGGTLMSFSGATLTYGGSVIMTSNGVKFFFNYDTGNSGDSFDIAEFTIATTTLTYVATVAAGSTAAQFAGKFAVDSSENYYGTTGTILYQYDNAGALQYTSGGTFANITKMLNWGNTLYGSDNGKNLLVKLYVPDTDMSGLGAGSKKVGVGETSDIEWLNIQFPFIETDVAVADGIVHNLWQRGNNVTNFYYTYVALGTTNDTSIRTYQPLAFIDDTGSPSDLAFNSGKQVISQFNARYRSGTAFQAGSQLGFFGAITATALADALHGTNTLRVAFVVDASGNLYGSCATGAAFTDTAIAGVTITQMNVYRIEYDPANSTPQARFYVNGVLKATVTANVPTAVTTSIYFGAGGGDTGGGGVNNHLLGLLSAPNFAIEI